MGRAVKWTCDRCGVAEVEELADTVPEGWMEVNRRTVRYDRESRVAALTPKGKATAVQKGGWVVKVICAPCSNKLLDFMSVPK